MYEKGVFIDKEIKYIICGTMKAYLNIMDVIYPTSFLLYETGHKKTINFALLISWPGPTLT